MSVAEALITIAVPGPGPPRQWCICPRFDRKRPFWKKFLVNSRRLFWGSLLSQKPAKPAGPVPSEGVRRGTFRMPHRRSFGLPLAAMIATAAVLFTSVAAAAEDSHAGNDDWNVKSTSKRFGEEAPHPGVKTVRHWSGQSVVNGVTYTYDIVGADPSTEHAATIGVDIIPLNLTV